MLKGAARIGSAWLRQASLFGSQTRFAKCCNEGCKKDFSNLHVIVDICVIPITGSVSVAKEVAYITSLIRSSGLKNQLHGYGTNIEGPWDDVFALIKKCHTALHERGVVRISSTIKCGTRTDKEQSFESKIKKVN